MSSLFVFKAERISLGQLVKSQQVYSGFKSPIRLDNRMGNADFSALKKRKEKK